MTALPPGSSGRSASEMKGWEITRHGGWRRAGVAQFESATQMKWRSVVRIHPPVLIRLNERLGLPWCPYVVRWRVETPIGSIRLHHWLAPDDDRAMHDHPWWFLTMCLRGGYVDHSPSGDDHLRPGSIRYRPAEHQHTVFPDPGGAWTIFVTGPKSRDWGFWVAGRFRKANKYFARYGHHPCADAEKGDEARTAR